MTTMMTVILAAVVFGLSMLGMAAGLLMGRAGIRGTCGGLAALCDGTGSAACEACPHRRPLRPPARARGESEEMKELER
jgi:hypothetical protein